MGIFSRSARTTAIHGTRRVARRDAGITYVEVLVSVILLGIGGVSVLGAAASSGGGARVERSQADQQLVVSATADVLTGITPSACSTAAATYQTAARNRFDSLNLQAGWVNTSVTVTKVQTYNLLTNSFDSTCLTSGATQKITLKVVTPDGKSSATMDVLTASATATTAIGNPLAYANSQFSITSKGDVTIAGDQVYGALAVGGNLNFTSSGPITANSPGTFGAVLGAATTIGLVVDGKVDFANSSGSLYVNNNTSAVIGDMSNGKYIAAGGTNCFTSVTTATQCGTGAQIALQGGSGNAVAGHPFDFAGAYDAYTKASVALGALPGVCLNAAAAVLKDQNGVGPWTGSGNFVLSLTSGKVNTLTLTAAQLTSMSGSSAVGASSTATASTPLIINVLDLGAVSFTVPNFPQNYPRSVIWNFPNATSLTFSGALWGSLDAPGATVTLNADVRGVVIAAKVVGKGGVADWSNRPDINDINCDRLA